MIAETAPKGLLPLLFQDAHFVAVYKPANLFIHRTALSPERDVLLQRLRDQLDRRVYPIHRLDRATAGVVIFGLSSEDAGALCPLFEAGEVGKSYLAVVRGYTKDTGTADSPMKDDRGIERQACTTYRRLATVELPYAAGRYDTTRLSLVTASPKTGRRHQIRRHLARLGYPIIGDAEHGDARLNRFFADHLGRRRLMLLSQQLVFTHPFSGEPITVTATPDEVFTGILQDLSFNSEHPAV